MGGRGCAGSCACSRSWTRRRTQSHACNLAVKLGVENAQGKINVLLQVGAAYGAIAFYAVHVTLIWFPPDRHTYRRRL
jgi:hypothetical protein